MKKFLNKKIVIILSIAILLIGGLLYFKKVSSASEERIVDTISLNKSDLENYIKVKGEVESMDKRDITSDIEEKIEKLYVKEGDVVKKGQILMKLEEKDFDYKLRDAKIRLEIEEESLRKLEKDDNFELETRMANTKIQYEDAKKEYERNQILFESGGVSQVTLDKSKDSMDQLSNDLRLLEDGIRNSQISNDKAIQAQRVELAKMELNKLQTNRSNYTITSPIGGTVIDKNISEEGIVKSHINLMTIIDMDNIEIVVNMSEYDASKVDLGDSVEITGDSLGPKKFEGRVKKISNIARPKDNGKKDNTIEVKIDIQDKDSSFKIGASVRVNILTDRVENVFNIPYEAILTKADGKKYIYVIRDGKVDEIKIDTGVSSDYKIEILGELEEGLEVILNPTEDLKVGELVTSKEGLENDKDQGIK